jgi:hypothetical protein
MRIINEKNNECLDSILIMLTPDEASELSSKLNSINPNVGEHIHVNDENYQTEIIIAIYTDQNINYFTETIKNIIIGKKQ